MPGKSSNVNSAVRQFYHMVSGDRSSYMLTIIDAGVWRCVRCAAFFESKSTPYLLLA
jgi:hypothetical protein